LRRALLLLTLTLIPIGAKGGELKELIERALKSSPKVVQARSSALSARYEVKEAYGNYLPKLSWKYIYTDLSDSPSYQMALPGLGFTEFRLFKRKFYQWEIGAEVPVFTGGRVRSLIKVKRAKAKRAEREFKEVESRVISEVAQNYYEVLKAKGVVKAAEEALRAAKEHYRVVKAFFDEGIVPRRDLLEAQVKVSQAEEALERAKGYYIVALEKLRSSVGDYSVTPKGELSYRLPPVKESLGELIKKALKGRALIKAAEKALEGAKGAEDLAKSQFSPQIGAQLAYHRTDQYPMNGNFGYKSASLVISFPIFNGGKRFWEIRRAKEEKVRARAALEEVRRAVRLQVVAAYTELQTAKKRFKSSKRRVEEAKELLKDSKERYKEQVGTSTEVVDAIAYLQEAESSLAAAAADYYKALYKLRFAVGEGAP